MRMSVEYKTEKFPVAYQMQVVSLIKEAIKKVDEDYYKKIYSYGDGKANKRTKNFSFSVFMKGFERQEDIFIIKDRVIINITSPDYEFMVNLYNGLLQIKEFEYKDFILNKVRVNLIKEKIITKNMVKFNTLSPIFIQDANKNPLKPEDENYESELNYIVNEVLKNYRGYGLSEALKFQNINMKKRVVKEEIRNFKNNTNKRFSYANGYSGRFILEGNINDLNDIYKLGIGFKRSQGFGMIEVVK